MSRLVFDGLDRYFLEFEFNVSCPQCGLEHKIVPAVMAPLEDLGNLVSIKVLAKRLKLKCLNGHHAYVNEKGLKSYFVKSDCCQCDSGFVIVASMGEVNPTRMQVFFDGVMRI